MRADSRVGRVVKRRHTPTEDGIQYYECAVRRLPTFMHENVDKYVDKWETVRFGGLKCAKTRFFCLIWAYAAYAIFDREVRMFTVFNVKKYKLTAIIAVLMTSVAIASAILLPASSGQAQPIVVAIDAGHGGYDGGVTGLERGIKESDVNLSVATYLNAYLQGAGYKTVMTRTSDRAPVETGSLKRRDMDMRLAAIRGGGADIVVSIHCNFYPSAYRRGIQVFYDKANDLPLAEALQTHLNETQNLPTVGRQFAPLWGDYYLLKNAPCPAAIVECGFLSNREDEGLLSDANYRMTLAYQIFVAIDEVYGASAAPAMAW